MNLEKEIMDKSFKVVVKDPFEDEWLVLDVTAALKIAKQYAKEMCGKQRDVCAGKSYPVLDSELFREMQDKIRNAPLPEGLNK